MLLLEAPLSILSRDVTVHPDVMLCVNTFHPVNLHGMTKQREATGPESWACSSQEAWFVCFAELASCKLFGLGLGD